MIKKGFGLGSEPCSDINREVSLAGRETIEEASGLDGFCIKKFVADILTDGLDYSGLSEGTVLRTGEALLRITSVGKRCYRDCPVKDKPCAFSRGCAFAEVVGGGMVKEGDEIVFE